VAVIMANRERIEGRADLLLQVIGPTNQTLWKKQRNVRIPKDGKALWSGVVSASGSPGVHQLVVRLLAGRRTIAEGARAFYAFAPVERCDVPINVVDPQGPWREACLHLAQKGPARAPIHVVPPLANTIRAYPPAELAAVLAEVNAGAVALVFEPPDDWSDLAQQFDPAATATTTRAPSGGGLYHYAKLHPVFEQLPARRLMDAPYADVLSGKGFAETSEEDICGSLDPAAASIEDGPSPWRTGILVHRLGGSAFLPALRARRGAAGPTQAHQGLVAA